MKLKRRLVNWNIGLNKMFRESKGWKIYKRIRKIKISNRNLKYRRQQRERSETLCEGISIEKF